VLDFAARLGWEAGVPGVAASLLLAARLALAPSARRRFARPDSRSHGVYGGFPGARLVDASYFVIDLAFVFCFTLGVGGVAGKSV
jgi:hypothetical protein